LVGRLQVSGVRAQITELKRPAVIDGQVAGWVGVGGIDAGPSGEPEWIQVGLAGFTGGDSQLYYEITERGKEPAYTPVADISRGASFTVGVVEIASRPNWWRVEVDGRTASPPVWLPGSHQKWQATATSETWNRSGACNRFSYRFDEVSVYRSAAWRPLETRAVLSDRGYAVRARTASSFVAKSVFRP